MGIKTCTVSAARRVGHFPAPSAARILKLVAGDDTATFNG